MSQRYGADNIYSLSPLRVIVHSVHGWKCTKDAQIRVGRSEDREHKTLSAVSRQLPLTETVHIRIFHNHYQYQNYWPREYWVCTGCAI